MSSASAGGRPCRRRNAKIGRQYVRQSFSSASCAAGDSPCASSTTLQCVVVNAAPPESARLASLAVVDVTSWGAALTVRGNQKIALNTSPRMRFWLRQTGQRHVKTCRQMKNLWLVLALFVGSGSFLFGNGGAWQTGIPSTGNASASENEQHTDVTIENETLKIDLHPEHADVTVRYRMHNAGPKVQQEFFFPVELWGDNPGSDNQGKNDDLDHYQITVDGKELKWTNVVGPKAKWRETKEGTSEANSESTKANQERTETKVETSEATQDNREAEENSEAEKQDDETTSESIFQEDLFTIKSWKKSVIPFDRNQTRDVTIHYKARYEENDESVSDDLYYGSATFAYSLSPAATWKGPIGKGKIELNILHAEPEDVLIQKPKERFKKISDTHYEWEFENLKPTLADDIRIVAHSKYDSYPTGYSEEDLNRHAAYIIRNHQYFLDHKDYDATASSTLAPEGKHHYEVENIKGYSDEGSPWAEGAKDD